MENFLLIIFGVAGLLAVLAVVMMVVFKKKVVRFSPEKYSQLSTKISQMINSDDINLQRQAVVEADKLLDAILKTKVSGKDLGARLIAAQKIINNRQVYSDAWEAHKLRNKLVHDVHVEISSGQCKQAVSSFRRVFNVLGYK